MENQCPLIIIPTYNEVENIEALLRVLLEKLPSADILVVDDNSPDKTGRAVEKIRLQTPRVHLMTRKEKGGLASAYVSGFHWGLEKKYPFLVQMDADFSHDPGEVHKLLDGLKKADVAVGCRYTPEGAVSGWSWLRKGISRGGNLYAKFVLGLPYEDLTGGFNAWKYAVLKQILAPKLHSKGYAFQVELKNRAHKAGYKICEVPIHFRNRKYGKSKMSGAIVWEAAFRVLQMRTAPAH